MLYANKETSGPSSAGMDRFHDSLVRFRIRVLMVYTLTIYAPNVEAHCLLKGSRTPYYTSRYVPNNVIIRQGPLSDFNPSLGCYSTWVLLHTDLKRGSAMTTLGSIRNSFPGFSHGSRCPTQLLIGSDVNRYAGNDNLKYRTSQQTHCPVRCTP